MAWPLTGAGSLASGFIAQGVTGICWGTDALLQSPKPSSGYAGTGGFYVVQRFNQKTLAENIRLPGGVGPTLTRVQIVDGQQWTITVRDDTGMTPPRVGDSVSIVDAGKLMPGATSCQRFAATVLDSDYEAAPKQAGERVLLVENLINVESQSGSAQL